MMKHHLLKSWLSGVAGAALIATAAVAQGSGAMPQNPSAAPAQSQSQAETRGQAQGQSQDDTAMPAAKERQKSAAPSGGRNAKSGESGDKAKARSSAQDTREKSGQAAQDDKSRKTQRNEAQRDRSGRDAKPSARTTGQDSTQQSRDSARENRTQDRGSARETNTRDQAAQPSRDGNRAAANLSEQQRTRISQSVARLNVEPVRNVNFSVSVGAVVPRSVRLHTVPSAIVEIYPQYRGYQFVLVEDEIVIVQPRTKKIVAVLPYSGGARAARASTRKSITLSDRDRAAVRRTVTRRTTTGVAVPESAITIGETLPETVVIERFPDTIYRRVPALRSYHYVVRENDVYIVDPRERRVIEVIE